MAHPTRTPEPSVLTESDHQLAAIDVDIAPEVSVIGVFRHLNYKPWFAIAEFVDNALQSYLLNRERLESPLSVDIQLDNGSPGMLRITDNAAGISPDDWRRALRPADPPPNLGGLSEFGMGMKTAAAWFGQRLDVTSRWVGDGIERTASVDFDQVVAEKTRTAQVTPTNQERGLHGTAITVSGLYRAPRTTTIGKIRDHLASIYRQFLRRGEFQLYFLLNANPPEAIRFEEVEILRSARYDDLDGAPLEWRKPIHVELGEDRRVSGFAALRARGSTGYAGFALFRRNRVIVGSADETYRPSEIFGASTSPLYQRLFGELEVEGIDVTHTKDGFNWMDLEEPFLSALRQQLEEEPLPLVHQARRYPYGLQRETVSALEREAQDAVDSTATAIQDGLSDGPAERSQARTTGDEEAETPVAPSDQPDVRAFSRTVEFRHRSEPWEVRVEVVDEAPSAAWVEVLERRAPETIHEPFHLSLKMSLQHPFTERFAGVSYEHLEIIVRIAAALVLAEVMARQSGVRSAGEIRRRTEELLTSVFARH